VFDIKLQNILKKQLIIVGETLALKLNSCCKTTKNLVNFGANIWDLPMVGIFGLEFSSFAM